MTIIITHDALRVRSMQPITAPETDPTAAVEPVRVRAGLFELQPNGCRVHYNEALSVEPGARRKPYASERAILQWCEKLALNLSP